MPSSGIRVLEHPFYHVKIPVRGTLVAVAASASLCQSLERDQAQDSQVSLLLVQFGWRRAVNLFGLGKFLHPPFFGLAKVDVIKSMYKEGPEAEFEHFRRLAQRLGIPADKCVVYHSRKVEEIASANGPR